MNPHLGRIETADSSLEIGLQGALKISLPITPGTAHPIGTVLQIDGTTHKLEPGDLTARSYIAADPIEAADPNALVYAFGPIRFQGVKMPGGAAITINQALDLMSNTPIVLV